MKWSTKQGYWNHNNQGPRKIRPRIQDTDCIEFYFDRRYRKQKQNGRNICSSCYNKFRCPLFGKDVQKVIRDWKNLLILAFA